MIRRAMAEDVPRLAEIHVYGWRFAYRGLIPDVELFKNRLVAKSLQLHQQYLKDDKFATYVAEEEEILKAFMITGPSRDADKPEAYELAALYVEPQFIRKGIGSQLIQWFEELGAGLDKQELLIWVLERNAVGRSFYEKHGYKPDGATKPVDEWGLTEMRVHKLFGAAVPNSP